METPRNLLSGGIRRHRNQPKHRSQLEGSLFANNARFSVTHLCPYVCSTVEDFQNEHEILHEKVFPKLNEICRLRHTFCSPVDFGWNRSSKAQEQSIDVFRLHFDYVSKCSPFFIGLLGERYGLCRDRTLPPLRFLLPNDVDYEDLSWLDKNILCAVDSGHVWALDYKQQYCSLMEMEIRMAAFPLDPVAADAARHFCFFYFRQPDHLELLEDEEKPLSTEESGKMLNAVYLPESEMASVNLDGLKRNIVKKGFSIQYFGTPLQLASYVLEDWKAVIDSLFPPLETQILGVDWTPEEMEMSKYASIRLQKFVSTEKLLVLQNEMTAFALDSIAESGGSVLLIIGDRGRGKSSLIASWVESFIQSHHELKLFIHFAGTTANSSSIVAMMRRCISQLRSTKHIPGNDFGMNMEDATDIHRLVEAFKGAIASEPCILVLDNIDEISRGEELLSDPKMNWLPFPLPPNVRVIATCSRSGMMYQSLSSRSDVKIVQFPTVDDAESQEAIVRNHMKLGRQAIHGGNVQLAVNSHLASFPLFLSLMAAEIRSIIDSKQLLRSFDLYMEAQSFCYLWGLILRRWVDDYSWTVEQKTSTEYEGWIPDALRLISSSRNGVAELDLLAILHRIGYRDAYAISSLDWFRFRLVASSVIAETSSGRLYFMHNLMKEVTDYLLHGSITIACGVVNAEDREEKENRKSLQSKILFHQHLSVYFTKQDHHPHRTEELPWHLCMVQNYEMLAKVISEQRLFLNLYGEGSRSKGAGEILAYWKILMKSGISPGSTYSEVLLELGKELESTDMTRVKDPKKCSTYYLRKYYRHCICIGHLLIQLDCLNDASDILTKGFEQLQRTKPMSRAEMTVSSRIQASIGSAFASCYSRRLDAAKWYTTALESINSLLDGVIPRSYQLRLIEAKGCILTFLGRIKLEDCLYSEAETMLASAQICMQRVENSVGNGLVLYNMALLKLEKGMFDECVAMLRSALNQLEPCYGRSHPNVTRIYSKLGSVIGNTNNIYGFDVDKSEELYRIAIQLNEELHGPYHITIAVDLFHLSCLLWNYGKSRQKEEAMELMKRSLDICILTLGTDHILSKEVACALACQESQLYSDLQDRKRQTTFKRKQVHPKSCGKHTTEPGADGKSTNHKLSSVVRNILDDPERIDDDEAIPMTVSKVIRGHTPEFSGCSKIFHDTTSPSGQEQKTLEDSELWKGILEIHSLRLEETGRKSKGENQKVFDDGDKTTTLLQMSPGLKRHLSCFEYNQNFHPSITSGPYAPLNSILDVKQYSLPSPGSLH